MQGRWRPDRQHPTPPHRFCSFPRRVNTSTQQIVKASIGLIVLQRPESARGDGLMFVTESNLAILVVALSAITAVVGLATFIQVQACRAEYARLREGLNRLSEDVKHLMVAEQRRFLKELKSSNEKDAPTIDEQPTPRGPHMK